MRLSVLLIFSLVILLAGVSFGQGIETYYINFEDGVHLPIYIVTGKNVSTENGWDGNAMYVSPDNGTIDIEIYNMDDEGDTIYSYGNVRKIYFEFWVVGDGNFEMTLTFMAGSIKETEEYMNYYKINMEGSSNSKSYSQIDLKNIYIVWGKTGGNAQTKLLFNGDSTSLSKFVFEINMIEYPKRLIYELMYPDNSKTMQDIENLNAPLEIGKYTYEPHGGLKSPYEITINFTQLPKFGGVLLDNIFIEYYKEPHYSTPVIWVIGATFMIATPIIIYSVYRKFFAKFK